MGDTDCHEIEVEKFSCRFLLTSEMPLALRLRKTRLSGNKSTEIWTLDVVDREIYLALFLRLSSSELVGLRGYLEIEIELLNIIDRKSYLV